MFASAFKYELCPVGSTPTWTEKTAIAYKNPVHVGDKVKLPLGGDIVRIVEVEHYESGSVAYFAR